MKPKVGIILAVLVLVAVALTWGYRHLTADLDTYEGQYTTCMEYAKSTLPGYRLEYPSKTYDDITRACEKQANEYADRN